jgi:hypothetical protein
MGAGFDRRGLECLTAKGHAGKTEEQILGWAKGHFGREGRWPVYKSGSIKAAPGETRASVDFALRYGKRGLPGGSSLAKLLANRVSTKAKPLNELATTAEVFVTNAVGFVS